MRIVQGRADVHWCCDKGGNHECSNGEYHVKREEMRGGVVQVSMQRPPGGRYSETFRWDCCCYSGFHFGTLPSRWEGLVSNWRRSAAVTRWVSRCWSWEQILRLVLRVVASCVQSILAPSGWQRRLRQQHVACYSSSSWGCCVSSSDG